jgi:hypothetical protein
VLGNRDGRLKRERKLRLKIKIRERKERKRERKKGKPTERGKYQDGKKER